MAVAGRRLGGFGLDRVRAGVVGRRLLWPRPGPLAVGLGHDGVDQVALAHALVRHAEALGDLLQLGQDLSFQLRALNGPRVHGHAPSFSSFSSLFQSARNFSRPRSVNGCFTSLENTSYGMVATSAPAWAASTTCMGWRREAASTNVSYPWAS